jgi:hypothetical protein
MINQSDKTAVVEMKLKFELWPKGDTARLVEAIQELFRNHVDGDYTIGQPVVLCPDQS